MFSAAIFFLSVTGNEKLFEIQKTEHRALHETDNSFIAWETTGLGSHLEYMGTKLSCTVMAEWGNVQTGYSNILPCPLCFGHTLSLIHI